MFDNRKPDVLVVGAGPVGLFAALSLAKQGVPVQVVDTGMWPCAHSYALALHPQSLTLLDELGLKDHVMQSAYPVKTMGIYDSQSRRAEVRLDQTDPSSYLAVLPQHTLEGLLEQALHNLGVDVLWRHEASNLLDRSDRVSATLDRYEKEARGYVVSRTEWVVAKSTAVEMPYVIGADGYNSGVRRALELDFPEVGPAHHFAVFEFKCDLDLANEMRIVFAGETTNVLWPLPNGYCRWSFQLVNYSDPESEQWDDYRRTYGFPTERVKDRVFAPQSGNSPMMHEDNLRKFIAERAPWFTSKIEEVKWRTVVRFERRLAPAFGYGRMWLAGDSAHLTGPVGIQSLNVGLAEARDLACKMSRILQQGAPENSLDAYDDGWTGVWRRLQGLQGGLRATPKTDPWISEHAAQLLSCLPAHGQELEKLAAQLGLEA